MLGHTKYALSSLTVASRQKCWSLLAAGLPAATVPSAARLSDSAACKMGSKEVVDVSSDQKKSDPVCR